MIRLKLPKRAIASLAHHKIQVAFTVLLLLSGASLALNLGLYSLYKKSEITGSGLREDLAHLEATLKVYNVNLKATNEKLAVKTGELQENTKKYTDVTAQKDALEKQVQNLQKEIASLKSRSYSSSPRTNSAIPVVNRIHIDDANTRNVVIDAIEMLRTQDYKTYQLIYDQVSDIYAIECTNSIAGIQVERKIYIGVCGRQTNIVASIITHEATHVYSVYVNHIYSMRTKAQELPSYQAQLASAGVLDLPQYYVDFINQQIAYYSSLPV